jgi:hypothetical protein
MYACGVRVGLHVAHVPPQTVTIVITTWGDVGVKRTPPCRLRSTTILRTPLGLHAHLTTAVAWSEFSRILAIDN